jgi:hypothetical protein
LPLVVIDTQFFSQIAIQYVWINPCDGFGIGPPIGAFIDSIDTFEAIDKNIVVFRIGLIYGSSNLMSAQLISWPLLTASCKNLKT